MISPEFLGSAEFAVATVSAMALVGLSVPLLAICLEHVSAGNVELACSFALLGVTVTGVSGWKLTSSVRRARARYVPTSRGDAAGE